MASRSNTAVSALAVACVMLSSSCSSSKSSTTSTPGTPAAAAPQGSSSLPPTLTPISFQVAPDLPPVPGNLTNAARAPETVRAAYLFAAHHPEVLRYMPCFCGCERGGHRGNDDCFVSSRDAAGKPTQWEPHGMVCEVCLDVATTAMQMHNSGASLTTIREAIEKAHSGAMYHTPTPMPKKGTDH
jgi:hypothetical protein